MYCCVLYFIWQRQGPHSVKPQVRRLLPTGDLELPEFLEPFLNQDEHKASRSPVRAGSVCSRALGFCGTWHSPQSCECHLCLLAEKAGAYTSRCPKLVRVAALRGLAQIRDPRISNPAFCFLIFHFKYRSKIDCGGTATLIQCWRRCKMSHLLERRVWPCPTKQPKHKAVIHQLSDPTSKNWPQTFKAWLNKLYTQWVLGSWKKDWGRALRFHMEKFPGNDVQGWTPCAKSPSLVWKRKAVGNKQGTFSSLSKETQEARSGEHGRQEPGNRAQAIQKEWHFFEDTFYTDLTFKNTFYVFWK